MMNNQKGFVTLATGKDHYYQLAANLLESYIFSTDSNRMPFAIICDRENEYTKNFDKVVLINNPSNSYMDKIEMLNLAPFEENIFIDADSLVYKDINDLFPVFDGLNGVRFIGRKLPLNTTVGWFRYDDIGDYKEEIKFIPSFHGGVFYFKNDSLTKEIYAMAKQICIDYSKYKFAEFEKPADEPIFALCTAVLQVEPIENNTVANHTVIFAPGHKFKCDILKHKLKKTKALGGIRIKPEDYKILHWQNKNTHGIRYKKEVKKLMNRNNSAKCFLVEAEYILKRICGLSLDILKNISENIKIYVTEHQKLRATLHKIKHIFKKRKL